MINLIIMDNYNFNQTVEQKYVYTRRQESLGGRSGLWERQG